MNRTILSLIFILGAFASSAALPWSPLAIDPNGKLPTGTKFWAANKDSLVPYVAANLNTAPTAIDPDVDAYAATAGVVDPNELINLDRFVSGLKTLNLWTNLVWANSLRSQHNAGSGSTAYSLKGGNATVNGGPTWNTNGINFSSNATQYLEFTNPLQSTAVPAWTIFAAFKTTPGYARAITSGLNGNSARGISTYANGSPSAGTSGTDTKLIQDWGPDGTSYSATTFNLPGRISASFSAPGQNQTAIFGYGPSEISLKSGINVISKTSLVSPTNAWNNGSVWRIGLTVDGALPMHGNVAGVFVWNKYLSETEGNSVRRLYCATIGSGYIPTIEVITEGDSLTAGSGSNEIPWPNLLTTNTVWGPLIQKRNISTGGEFSFQMPGQLTTQALPYLIDSKYFASKQYYLLYIGINDLSVSNAAVIFPNITNTWRAARNYGMNVVAFTPTPAGSLSAGQQTEYTNLCSLIRAATNSYDYLVDLQSVAGLNDWRNTNTLFQLDAIHLRDAGQQAVLTNILRVLPTP